MTKYFNLITLFLIVPLLFSCENLEEKMNKRFIQEMESHLNDDFFKRNIDIDIIELKVEEVKTFYLNESDSLITIFIQGNLINKAVELSGSENLNYFYNLENPGYYIELASSDLEFKSRKDKLNNFRFRTVFLVSFKIKYTTILPDGSKTNKLYDNQKFLFSEKFDLISD